MRRFREEFEEAHINLTPLIDVVFVVLIIFILIAPMLELDHVELATAPTGQVKEMAAPPESTQIAIHVRADNTIWFCGRRVTEKELLSLLKEIHLRHPKKVPQLFHDKKATFGTYQNVKNVVEAAGFEELDIVLKPG